MWLNLSDNSEHRCSLSEDLALAMFTIHRTGFLKNSIYIYLGKYMFTLLHFPLHFACLSAKTGYFPMNLYEQPRPKHRGEHW